MQPENQPGKAQDSKLHFLDYWRIIRIRKAVIFLVFLLVVITTAVVSVLTPPTFASTARINIKKDTTDINPLLNFPAGDSQFDPFWMQTQFQIIQSKKVLYPVIEDLVLVQAWAERFKEPTLTQRETFQILQNSIEIEQFQNTSFIEITAYSRDRDEAANIANSIAESYKKIRSASLTNKSGEGLKKLKESHKGVLAEIDTMTQEMDRLRRENDIIDLYIPEGSPVASTAGPQKLAEVEVQRTKNKAELASFKSLHQKLTLMDRDELRRVVLTVIPNNPRLSNLINSYDAVVQILVDNPLERGPDHPERKSKIALKEKLEEQIDTEIQATIDGLGHNIEIYEDKDLQLENLIKEINTKESTLAEVYRPYSRLKRERENKQNLADMVVNRIVMEEIDSNLPIESIVETYDEAEPALSQVRPNLTLNIALGVLVGLVAGVGLAFFIEYLDTSVKTIDDVEKAMESPVLGVIPQNVGSLLDEGAESPHAEAYRILRTNVLFSRKNKENTAMTVVSGGAGEGKSTTIFNLAAIFAQSGSRVLLVDSDLRRPSLHRILGISNARGLTDYLLEQAGLDEVIQTTKQELLDFLPSGKLLSSSMGVLNSERMKDFVEDMKTRYDFVLFDSPPIMGVSDASILTSLVDMALLVIQYRKYPQAMTIRAKQMVEKVGDNNLLGVVLNNINISQDSYYYYYSGYYYDYYSRSSQDEDSSSNGKPAAQATSKKTRRLAATPERESKF